MVKKSLHMVGNAHIDPVWLWRWQEGLHEIRATFRSALDRMREYPEFIFTCSSAAFYEWVEESDPAMFAEITERVREGRWRVVGGWWVQPDCNVPCGESFVRQGLLGQRYFRRAFGLQAKTGYNVDSFGHHGMLPQLLSKMGLERYVFMRPGPHEKDLPGPLFWWESADGSRVLTYRVPHSYTTGGREIDEHLARTAALLDDGRPELMCFYGVGNHGGGPTRENLDSIRRYRGRERGVEVRMSSPDEFFDAIGKGSRDLPVVRDELQHHARGCYSAHSEMKRLNRLAENRLLAAERFDAVASVLAPNARNESLERAWKNLLFNQFHDTLAGTAIEVAYADAREQLGEALSIAARSLNRSLQSIVWALDIQCEESAKPIVVFNPNAFPLRETVELEFLHEGQVSETGIRPTDELLDDEGRPIAYQLTQSQATVEGRSRICFEADLPALGYRVYRVRPRGGETALRSGQAGGSAARGAASGNRPADRGLVTGRSWAENEFLRFEVDEESGGLKSLRHKALGWEVLGTTGGPAGGRGSRAVVVRDTSDTWSHGIDRYAEVIGEFGGATVRVVERGPVRTLVRSVSTFGDSTLTQDYVLGAAARFLDVRVTLDWRERHALLKLAFPVAVPACTATCEIPFGTATRGNDGSEEPMQTWVDLSGSGDSSRIGEASPIARRAEVLRGLSLATDAKHGYSVEGSTLALTVVRSPIYAHHIPRIAAGDSDHRFMDQGEQRFRYRLLAHAGDWRESRTIEGAAALNNPPIALLSTFHRGSLPQCGAFVDIEGPGVVMSALKRAEEGDDLILRCYESFGREVEARMRLTQLGCTIRATFSPHEIKTFRIPRREPGVWREVNLTEEP